MIDFELALGITQEHCRDFGEEVVSLENAMNRVVREDWFCDRDLPPYDRVTMDGIAINYDGSVNRSELRIENVVAAGKPKYSLLNPENCVEIMTGAILPEGADTVIRYEDVEIHGDTARIMTDYRKGQNVHWKGEDRKKNDCVVASGKMIGGPEIGIGASIGKTETKVSALPKTLLISTGDELVDIHEIPLPHQIRKGNIYRIKAALAQNGIIADTAHLQDDMEEIVPAIRAFLSNYDLILLSGGVSKGKFDFLPEALDKCGVQKHFHRVAQRPGKPMWFGTHPDGATVFALPGNPISSFMCYTVYVQPWIAKCFGGSTENQPTAILQEEVFFKPDLTYFLEVRIAFNDKGQILAYPHKGHGSGDLANLTGADAFIRLDRGQTTYTKGSTYLIYFYR